MDRYIISESYTQEQREEYEKFHNGEDTGGCACFWPLPPPPHREDYIYLGGSGGGMWSYVHHCWTARLIHWEQYQWALEDARCYGKQGYQGR